MKALKDVNKRNPRDRNEVIKSFSEKIKSNQDSKNEERQVIEMLKKTSDPEMMAMAMEIAAKGKLVESISMLYNLLRSPIANTLNPKWMNPPEALILIGKIGLSALIEKIKKDAPENIPYQIIVNILYHWFDQDQKTLRDFLVKEKEQSKSKDQPKFVALIDAVDSWKAE